MSNDNKITFHSFTELVAKRARVSPAEADIYIHQLAKSIGEGLEKDGSVHLYHFGRFHTTHVDEQMGHNPNSGEPLTIPAHTRVHFRPYKALRFAVNAPFRMLRIKELNEDHTAWRTRSVGLALLLILIGLLILLGLGIRSWVFTQDESVVPPTKESSHTEVVRPLHKAPVASSTTPATVSTAPAKAKSIPAPLVEKPTLKVFSVSAGDTLWSIATSSFGDPFWWPVLYAHNRSKLSLVNPDYLTIGMRLEIPILAGSVNAPTTTDLQLKANGYKIVAKDYKKLNNPRAQEYELVFARLKQVL
ncbi:MAG: HU family DNA-binding protein [Helicobacteraceae bacterium]|nr:HU family DNA-binding protein [Helicobacteraceae bacterium]